MKIKTRIIVSITVFIILQLIFVSEIWNNFEKKIYDLGFQLRGKKEISNDIVIVSIDDATFGAMDITWPFPRIYYNTMIENLQKAGAKYIIFDLEFTESSDLSADILLAETAAKYDNVIFSGKIISENRTKYEKNQLLAPIPEIIDKQLPWGIVNIFLDNDNFVRQYTLYQNFNKKKYYSIGIKLLLKIKEINNYTTKNGILENNQILQIKDIIIPKFSEETCLINYYGPVNTFQRISFSDVIDDSTTVLNGFDFNAFYEHLSSDTFKDKIVLIGATAAELHDNFSTPFFKGAELMPGVEIHANFIEMCLNNDFISKYSYLKFFIIQILILIFLSIMNSFIKPSISIFPNILFFIGSFVGSYYILTTNKISFPTFEIPALIFFIYFTYLILHYIKTSNERKQIKIAFKHFLAPEIVNELLAHPEKLEYGGSQQVISVLFSDIRSFTTYTESHSPKETVSILREYLTAMVGIIIKYGGNLDKFVGDEIMALFGTPIPKEDHALTSCKVALDMVDELKNLHEKWNREGKDKFDIGIGISSGVATVGNLGSEQIFDYTAIGDTINLGARLEELNKEYETEKKIIISEFTYEMVKEKVVAHFLDEVKVKGKNISVKIYELIGLK